MRHFKFVNPNPFIMPNRLTGAPYLALGNYAIHAYLIYLTHVPYIMMVVHLTPFTTAPVFPQPVVCFVVLCGLRSTIIFTFSIIPYLILFVKHYFSYTNNQ